MKQNKNLTEVELELMTILWRLGEGTVHDVIAQLPPGRKLAYTSVSTMMRILEQKKVVRSEKAGRGHLYIPALSKAVYEDQTVQHVVQKVFDGAAVSLVKRLIDTETLSDKELQSLKQLLEERLK